MSVLRKPRAPPLLRQGERGRDEELIEERLRQEALDKASAPQGLAMI